MEKLTNSLVNRVVNKPIDEPLKRYLRRYPFPFFSEPKLNPQKINVFSIQITTEISMNLDYLAGFTDADGNFAFSISLRKAISPYQTKSGEIHTYRYVAHYELFRIGQTYRNEWFLKEVKGFLKEHDIKSFLRYNKKKSVDLVASGMKQVAKVCELLEGYLVLKESQRKAIEQIISIYREAKRGEYKDAHFKCARIWDNATKFRQRRTEFSTLEAKVRDIYGL